MVLNIDPRLLADGGWNIPEDRYRIALGESADRLKPAVEVSLPGRSWRDSAR